METKVTVVFPTYNVSETIKEVLEIAKKAKVANEFLVVDGYSTDNTIEEVRKVSGIKIAYQYKKQYPGKGIAVKTALKKASGSVLVFVDSDVSNFKSEIIDALALPIVKKEADFTIASFDREQGRVTEILVKPILSIFFPEIQFNQPLAGEFAIRKEILSKINIVEDWGVEIGLVIDLMMKGYRCKEIKLDWFKKHRLKSLKELSNEAICVLRTILSKVKEYDRIETGMNKI